MTCQCSDPKISEWVPMLLPVEYMDHIVRCIGIHDSLIVGVAALTLPTKPRAVQTISILSEVGWLLLGYEQNDQLLFGGSKHATGECLIATIPPNVGELLTSPR